MIADIVWELEQAFDGDPWHGPSFIAALDRVTAEIAARRPPGGAHSIAEIVRHVDAWQREVARRVIEGDWREAPAMGDWQEPVEWAASIGSLRESQESLLAAARSMAESRLQVRLEGSGYSYAVMLHGQAQHLAYHGGQIVVLKRVVAGIMPTPTP